VSAEREIWLERAGSLYPLLVATQVQTRLPVASQLHPSEGDLRASMHWLPLVGVGVGVLLSFVSALSYQLGLSAMAVAVLVVIATTVLGCLRFERALAQHAAASLGRWRSAAGQDGEKDDVLLVTISVVCLSLLLRVAAITTIAPGERTEALIAAAVLSRWVLSLGGLGVALRNSERGSKELIFYVAVAAAVSIIMGLCQGGSGLILMALAAVTMALVVRKADRVTTRISSWLALSLVVEIAVLLCQ